MEKKKMVMHALVTLSTNYNYAKWKMVIFEIKKKYLMNMHTCIFMNDANISKNSIVHK